MNPLAGIVALFWAAMTIAMAINISEKQQSVRGAVLMFSVQVTLIAFGLMPIIFGILNAS